MSLTTFLKDPEAVLDYTVDWGIWLDTDTISTSNWTVPAGITKDSSAISGANTDHLHTCQYDRDGCEPYRRAVHRH